MKLILICFTAWFVGVMDGVIIYALFSDSNISTRDAALGSILVVAVSAVGMVDVIGRIV